MKIRGTDKSEKLAPFAQFEGQKHSDVEFAMETQRIPPAKILNDTSSALRKAKLL